MDLSIGAAWAYDVPGRLIDPYDQASIDNSFTLTGDPTRLRSHQRILAGAREHIQMPSSLVGLVTIRSTWARLGLLAPPTVVDPGFEGYLTMELYNCSRSAIRIREGDKIWNLLLLDAVDKTPYTGRYQGQAAGPVLPKAPPEKRKEKP